MSFLRLLQLSSPALPVGAYTYSEGLETLVEQGRLADAAGLYQWLQHELRYGAIWLELASMARVYRDVEIGDLETPGWAYWNHWLSALRDAEELREQSWQMGRSLVRLLVELDADLDPWLRVCGDSCNFAIAYAVAAARWQIECRSALLGYAHSWASNLVNAGVKLIPLGQTAGQSVLLRLAPEIEAAVEAALTQPDDALMSCGWGLAIAAMTHETLYTRLFRS